MEVEYSNSSSEGANGLYDEDGHTNAYPIPKNKNKTNDNQGPAASTSSECETNYSSTAGLEWDDTTTPTNQRQTEDSEPNEEWAATARRSAKRKRFSPGQTERTANEEEQASTIGLIISFRMEKVHDCFGEFNTSIDSLAKFKKINAVDKNKIKAKIQEIEKILTRETSIISVQLGEYLQKI